MGNKHEPDKDSVGYKCGSNYCEAAYYEGLCEHYKKALEEIHERAERKNGMNYEWEFGVVVAMAKNALSIITR